MCNYNLIGKEVKHNKLGYGRIKQIKGAYIEIIFQGKSKYFQYPQAFLQLLTIQDSQGADYIRQLLRDYHLEDKLFTQSSQYTQAMKSNLAETKIEKEL